jgi:hypothetical protein
MPRKGGNAPGMIANTAHRFSDKMVRHQKPKAG